MSAGAWTVQLHAFDLLDPMDPDEDGRMLPTSERLAAERLPRPEIRRRRIRTLARLRRLLGSRLGIDPGEVPLSTGPHGKPLLVPRVGRATTHFNLTHTDRHVWIALGEVPLGIDLEPLDRAASMDPGPVVRRFFAPSERAAVDGAADRAARELEFLRIWTRKESLVKGVGRGLHCPLESFAVPAGPLPPEGAVVPCPEGTRRRWLLLEPPLPEAWRRSDVGALALDLGESHAGGPPRIRFETLG